MSNYEWTRYSGEAWFTRNSPPPITSSTVHEHEKPSPAVVYDHEGNALVRKQLKVGFDL